MVLETWVLWKMSNLLLSNFFKAKVTQFGLNLKNRVFPSTSATSSRLIQDLMSALAFGAKHKVTGAQAQTDYPFIMAQIEKILPLELKSLENFQKPKCMLVLRNLTSVEDIQVD